jgi:hypothetical protein
MLRQAENKVKIEGILAETDLKYGSYVRNGETIENIGGSIKVLVEQTINDQNVTLEVPVYMFSTKLTKAGKINPAYESIENVMKNFVSIAACGSKEQATKIRITSGNIRMNEFMGQGGTLVSQPRVNASFVGLATGEFKPEATFSLEFVMSECHYEVDNQGVELDPPKLAIMTILPQYGGKVDVVKLTATNPNVISAIEQYWEAGNTYHASGRLNFSSTTKTEVIEEGFGEPQERTRTINVSEFIVTGGAQEPLDDEYAFDGNDIRTALAERKQRLEDMKNQQAQPKSTPAPTSSKGKFDLGF